MDTILNWESKGNNPVKVNIIGLGYIGLPTALMFAANGVEVVGSDKNQELIDKLKSGKVT